jgi:hypothetical protein
MAVVDMYSCIILTDPPGEYASDTDVNWDDWDRVEIQPDGTLARQGARITRSNRTIGMLTDEEGEAADEVNWDDWDRVEIQPDGTLDRRSARITRSNRTTQLLTDPDGEAADDVNWDDWDRVAISSQGTVDAASYDRSQTRRNRAANPDNSIIITDQKGEF